MRKYIVFALLIIGVWCVCGCNRENINDTTEDIKSNTDAFEEFYDEISSTIVSETEEDAEIDVEKEAEVAEPVEVQEEVTIVNEVKNVFINFENCEECFAESAEEATPFVLSLVSEQDNGISEVLEWFAENELFLPMLSNPWSSYIQSDTNMPYISLGVDLDKNVFYDEQYLYEWERNQLNIYDVTNGQLLYVIEYQMDKWYLMGNCAYLRDSILYIGFIYNGYAMPGTCFLMAYDIENDKVLWRSEDQTYNSMNFIVKEDVIICGYGFTSEKDYIYQLDTNTGKVIDKTEVKKMPDMIVEKDGQLYVHTYSYDYVFHIDSNE